MQESKVAGCETCKTLHVQGLRDNRAWMRDVTEWRHGRRKWRRRQAHVVNELVSILLEVNGWADRWTYELLGVDLRHCIVTPSCRTCSLSRPCATIATTQSCYISGLDRTQALGIFGLLRPPVIVAVCCTRHINKYVDTVTSLELGRTFNLLLVIRALNYGIICLTILNR